MDSVTQERLNAEIEQLQFQLQDLRRQERNIQAREKGFATQPQVANKDIKKHLQSFLPDNLMPRNVGGYNSVAWPFYFQIDFDFGTNPAISSVLRQTQSFQVTQEAALLLLKVSLQSDSYSTAGRLGPWNVEMRDRQSSRQFNDRPIPIQMFGSKGKSTSLPTPMLLMPNAFFDVTMSSWLPAGITQNTTGEGKFQFSFHGLRIRVEDYDKVLSSIFR